ncbi:MAG TPA: YoaK family protein [Burkholderiaceae bacterium]
MLLRYLHRLSDYRRSLRSDRHLGYVLAFVAGAVNAGGFLAIGQYTSHMSGIVSSMADHLALREFAPALAALAAWLAFVAGAVTTALLINLARRRGLRSQFALSLLVEAGLLLLFGLAGANLADMREFLAPLTVLLLCFIMGLQNAIITKASGAVIRTTHVTGLSTDLGIELGKLFYYNRRELPELTVRANRGKLMLHALLIAYFFGGGLAGALGFKHIGYKVTIPLAVCLALLAMGPILTDLRSRWKAHRRGSA